MKRFAYYIACCSLVALFSCTHDDVDGSLVSAGDGKITIQSTLDDMIITRVADEKQERKITHIDVFAVDKNGAIVYYERDKTGNDIDDDQGKGKLTLGVARQAKKADGSFYFAQGEEYSFVLVANAVANERKMRAITSLDELELAVQDDSFKTDFGEAEGSSSVDPSMSRQTLLHLTGTKQGTNEDHKIPQVFLMDAVATDSKDNTKWVVNSTSDKGNLNLSAEFKRAASKIIVNITQGADVEFHTKLQEENTQYDFYKLPASTFVLPNQSKLVGVQLINTAPMGPNEETFIWAADGAAENNIQVIGYAYSHSWSDVDLANETSLILNIPMKWNKDNDKDHTKEEDAPRSWYKVPLSQGKKFDRNKCYIVNVKINAVGAQSRSTAIKLEDIEYVTLDWVDVPISVGNSEERPKYLILNTDLVEMYNVNFDNTSLSFSSSSAITSVKLKDVYSQNTDGTFTSATDTYSAYYVNKFGVKTNLSDTIRNTISATAEQGVLNGGINIISLIRQSSPSEVTLALEALGEEPVVPTEPDNTEGKPDPEDYLPSGSSSSSNPEWENINGWKQITTTTTTSYSFEGNACYKTTTTDKTYSDRGTTYHVEGYPNTSKEEYSDNKTTQYFTLLNEWSASHPEYQEYLDAKAKYDAYQKTKTAIENSDDSGVEETHYNTIRYLEFEVTNADGLTATFRVMQYPVIYITNQQGWYSYRDDFINSKNKVVTYILWKNNDNSTNNYTRCSYDSDDETWNYYTDNNSNSLFCSKYVYSLSTSGENQGKSRIDYYYWNDNEQPEHKAVWSRNGTDNARMYHVRVTATSSTYTVGRPRLDSNGFTDDGEENAKLVSPSFMLASQLGATQAPKDMLEAADHCRQYVEVASDGTEYHDWRLPTAAEIDIVIELQKKQEAIDIVLAGISYWSATGIKETNLTGATGEGRVRCVRDAY